MVLGVCRRSWATRRGGGCVSGDLPGAGEEGGEAPGLQFADELALRRGPPRGQPGAARGHVGVSWNKKRPSHRSGPRARLERSELRSVIDEEIRRLPERYRLPLLLCHVEGLRHDEVAQRLGCPVGTVESRLSRARQQLRARLERRGLARRPRRWEPSRNRRKPDVFPPRWSRPPSRPRSGRRPARPGSWPRRLRSHFHASFVSSPGFLPGPRWSRRPWRSPSAPPSAWAFSGSTARRLGPARCLPLQSRIRLARARAQPPRVVPIDPLRPSSAVASPISGITIDGRLDDWPKDLESYPIRRHLSDRPASDAKSRERSRDPEGHFQAGYDHQAGLIYLAVVVRDSEFVVPVAAEKGLENNRYETDAVEVYVDGPFAIARSPNRPGTGVSRSMPRRCPFSSTSAFPAPPLPMGTPGVPTRRWSMPGPGSRALGWRLDVKGTSQPTSGPSRLTTDSPSAD